MVVRKDSEVNFVELVSQQYHTVLRRLEKKLNTLLLLTKFQYYNNLNLNYCNLPYCNDIHGRHRHHYDIPLDMQNREIFMLVTQARAVVILEFLKISGIPSSLLGNAYNFMLLCLIYK